MKFWELRSVFREQMGELREVLREDPRGEFLRWFEDCEQHCHQQDRDVLDAPVPQDLVFRALRRLPHRFHVIEGNLRRADEAATGREVLCAEDVARRYGAEIIEEVLEKGSAPIVGILTSASVAELRGRLEALLHMIHTSVPDFPMGSIPEYVDVGEFKLALEDLTSNLHELGVVLAPDIRGHLVDACRILDIDALYWSDLYP